MSRVKIADLEALVSRINTIKETDRYRLSGAYSGWKLVKVAPKPETWEENITHGFDSKKDLHTKLTAIVTGLQL